MATTATWFDANFSVATLDEIGRHSQFESEKAMCDLLEANIHDFCRRALRLDVQSYQREYQLGPYVPKGGIPPHVDFKVITSEGKRVFIECKNPRNTHDLHRALSQLLCYGARADYDDEPVDELVIATSMTYSPLHAAILKYRLPVTIIIFTPDSLGVWNREVSDQLGDQLAEVE